MSPQTRALTPVTEAPDVEAIADLRSEAERLIAAAGRPVGRITLRSGDTTLEIEWAQPPTVVAAAPEPAAEARPALAAVPDQPTDPAAPPAADVHHVRSPLVGTFYRSASPTDEPFVEVGAEVRAGDQLGIVEAMKLMNPIVADADGVVVALPAADGEMVEFEQVVAELGPTAGQEG